MDREWELACLNLGIPKSQIMIVEELLDDDKHTLITLFSNVFIHAGFAVRRKREIIPCMVCGCAIPSPIVFPMLKRTDETWSEICQGCTKNKKRRVE
jgi:hypothetical protein